MYSIFQQCLLKLSIRLSTKWIMYNAEHHLCQFGRVIWKDGKVRRKVIASNSSAVLYSFLSSSAAKYTS